MMIDRYSMIDYTLSFMREIGFDDDAVESLYADIKKIYGNEESKKLFNECVKTYEEDMNTDLKKLIVKADDAGKIAGVHRYSAELLMLICLSKQLRKNYKERGIDEKIWFDSMCDLKWKLWECKAVKGIWGTFVADWFSGWFDMTRFALGRLQFEMIEFYGDYQKDGKTLKTGDKVINVHIPRTLTPLDKKSRDESYERAKEFFADKTDGASVAFVCSSWLLYPEAIGFLSERSNIREFVSEYDIIRYKTNEEGKHPDMWRLFDMDIPEDFEEYPENSSLRKAYKEHLKRGGRTGSGYGVKMV